MTKVEDVKASDVKSPPSLGVKVAETPPADPEKQFQKLLQGAKAKERRNRPREAAEEYKKALAIKPDSPEALLGVGIALVDVSPKEAVSFLDKGLSREPDNGRALVALGMAQQSLGKMGAAETAYKKYLILFPTGDYADEIRAILQNMK